MSANNGKPCRKCGGNEWNKHDACVFCHRESSRQWYHANKEKAREKSRQWYIKNREYAKGKSSQWYKDNRDRAVETDRKWRRANRDKDSASGRKWYASNKDKKRAYGGMWRKVNTAAVSATRHRRRTQQTAAGGSYTASEWDDLVKHYKNKCLCCGRDNVQLTADHIIPVTKGGSSNIDNIQPLCRSCNSKKHNRTIDYRPDMGIAHWIQKKLLD